jgi:purine nucleosidase
MLSLATALRTLAISTALTLSAHVAFPQKQATQFVLVDTDIGDDIDDAFALAYAFHTPEFHILGITTTFGDTELRAHLVAHLVDDAHHASIPIAAGIPTKPAGPFTQAAYAHADTHTLSSQSAADLILQTAREHPGQVTLVAIGPLFNIGAAIDRDPATFRLLKRVVVMGGSITHGYDDDPKTTWPSSEWNIRNDPASLRKLLATGVPIYLMPLDSTQILLPATLQTRIFAQSDTLSQALAELTREAHRPVILYDVLTTAFAANPTLCPTTPMHLEVDDKGFTRPTPGKPNANVCLKSDEVAFIKLFSQRLTISPHQGN